MFLVHHGILPFLHQMKFGLDPIPVYTRDIISAFPLRANQLQGYEIVGFDCIA